MEAALLSAKEYLKGWMPYRIKRYWFYALVTIFTIIVPFIKVGGNHLFLLSFDKLKLHLFFVEFDMQELYLMPFILMIVFIGIFGITVFGGRMFCGWMCPQTIFRVVYRDLIETKLLKLRKSIKNKQKEPDYSKAENKIKRLVAIIIWTVLAFLAASDLMWFFVPPEDFFSYIANPSEHMVLMGTLGLVTLFLVYDVIFLKENFCVYVCPYSRVQSVLYDDDTLMAVYDFNRGGHIYDEHKNKQITKQSQLGEFEECTTCESCVTVCPTHIDIREGLQLECINCLECVDACTPVMAKFNRPTLVNWSSSREIEKQEGKTRYFRPKIIGYIVILAIVTVLLGYMGTKKENMLLNVNKENRLFGINKGANGSFVVDNSYIFLFQNTQKTDHKFFFSVELPQALKDKGTITIDRPKKPFTVHPDVKKKTIVVLKTSDMLVSDTRKDTVIPIVIKAYAVDDPENIVVIRHSTFTFPRADLLSK